VTITAPSGNAADADADDAQTKALFREAKRRQRRRRLGWVLLVLFVLAVAAVGGWRLTGPQINPHGRTNTVHSRAIAAATPKMIVGWTSSSRLVVVSSRTGLVERTLATNVSILAPGLPSVSVAPGGTVFFESSAPAPYMAKGAAGDQILSVPIAGGRVRDIAPGSDPEVSPNGRLLAYISPDPRGAAGEAPYLVPPVSLTLATLSPGGSIVNVRALAPGSAQVNQGASDLSWSNDSKHLSFDLLNPTTNATTTWDISVGTDGSSLAAAHRIPLDRPGLTWNGYWGDGRTGAPIGVGVATQASGAQTIVTIDPRRGRVVRRLFTVPAEVCTAADTPSVESCFSDFSDEVIGDSSGTSVLVAGAIPLTKDGHTTSGRTILYRWDLGSRTPAPVARQILVAAWGPPPG
jgi:hypothetical protein